MFERWREEWKKLRGWRWKADRPYRLIVFALMPLAIVAILEPLFAAPDMKWLRDWVGTSKIFGPIFFPEGEVDWNDRLQFVLGLLALPVLFCLWYWRDRNSRDQIENARKDINLKEFQEVQLRAAGALDEKLPAKAREQLQIAALHQLRGFLRGEYGDAFRRPAFELLLAGHASAVDAIGVNAIRDYLDQQNSNPETIYEKVAEAIAVIRNKLDPVMRVRIGIICDEYQTIFRSGYPLNGRDFSLIKLPENSDLTNLELFNCKFIGATLNFVNFENSDLRFTQFMGADLSFARMNFFSILTCAFLEGVDLSAAKLANARLFDSNFRGGKLIAADMREASLSDTNFEAANLQQSKLGGSDLANAKLAGANISGAELWRADLSNIDLYSIQNCEYCIIDQFTQFEEGWDYASEEQRQVERQRWIARGAEFAPANKYLGQ